MTASPLTRAREGVRVQVRLAPGARADGFRGVGRDARGRSALKLAVTAPAEKGRANAAMIRLLAKGWRLPKGAIQLAAGAGGRDKTLLVLGDPEELMGRLESWLKPRRE
jgi:uncharacterized protein (TIGR00251 family)